MHPDMRSPDANPPNYTVYGSHNISVGQPWGRFGHIVARSTSRHIAACCTQVAVDTPGGLMVPNIKAFDVGIGYFPVCRMQLQQHVSSCGVLFFQRNSNTQKTQTQIPKDNWRGSSQLFSCEPDARDSSSCVI